MAYAKKTTRRYRRARRARRYTRKRRYRRYYPRRSGKRFPKGTEVKSVSKSFQAVITSDNIVNDGVNYIQFTPGYCTMFPSNNSQEPYSFNIPTGNYQGQRIGAKIEPIKLRISGSISLEDKNPTTISAQPNFWQVRCIVYQVKGGNTNHVINNKDYHQLAMQTTTGGIGADQIQKLLMTYSVAENQLQVFTEDDFRKNNYLCKIPLRRGIGGIFKVLYKKSFWINTQKTPVKNFRFITKCPRRLVYPEQTTPGDQNNSSAVANDAIYIVWFFQPGSFTAARNPWLHIDYNIDLFYTDK